MRRGRFLTACLLYIGALGVAGAVLGYALEPGSGLPWTAVWLVVGLGPGFLGVERLRKPDQEKRPEEYGRWAYALTLFLVGFTAWLGYAVWPQ